MSDLTTAFAELLTTVTRSGDYYVSGTAELMAPLIEVEGIGPVALPLLPVQAEALAALAEPAPYGRGPETLIDPAVRNTLQIGAERVQIRSRHWAGMLETILAQVADGLGISGPVSAEFYKLLIYEAGGFFIGHRDTEKAAGMFGTLVLVLPSSYQGGGLVVRHKGRSVELDLTSEDPSQVRFAAFYCDCVHEVLPVTDGCRLTLIYNLLRPGQGTGTGTASRLEPPDYQAEQDRLAERLRRWAAGEDGEDGEDGEETPDKLIYPLEHAYTPAELGFDTLKGADAAAARVAVAAAAAAGCDLQLALLSIEESGVAEYKEYPRRSRSRSRSRYRDDEGDGDDDIFEAGEVCDRSETLSDWRCPDGSRSVLTTLPVEGNELSPPGVLEEIEPDDIDFTEATGNEGASFERSYHVACLVLWPRARFLAVLTQAGFPAALAHLTDLAERWTAAGADRAAPEWSQAHELSGYMLRDWPDQRWNSWQERNTPSNTAGLAEILIRLEDAERIETLLGKVAARGGFAREDGAVLCRALARLAPARALEALGRLCHDAAASTPAACARLLAGCTSTLVPALVPAEELAAAATLVVQVLAAPMTKPAFSSPLSAPQGDVDHGLVVDLLTALAVISPDLADRAVGHLLALPGRYDLDAILIPAMCELIADGGLSSGLIPPVERLRRACIDHLRTRMAEPLAPPADGRRDSTLPCSCADCTQLAAFLANPALAKWEFRAAEPRRRHLEHSIRSARSDVTVITVRQGSPHRLVCTKTQASYNRRLNQRERDAADLARLQAE